MKKYRVICWTSKNNNFQQEAKSLKHGADLLEEFLDNLPDTSSAATGIVIQIEEFLSKPDVIKVAYTNRSWRNNSLKPKKEASSS